ncbi:MULTISPECIES: helix-turn-helix transcriptional regulator [unclassified Isoptericola]|uniref:helix-turn-helix transcriptional regulator n=1 Tax=unclassified Isoptericola TaxID=2623355 RepID=UPI0036698AC7
MTDTVVGTRGGSTGLVGRDDELQVLAAALSGAPAVAVVTGEPGIGKTRLVAELRARHAEAGRPEIVGACRRIGDPFPLGPVVQGLLRHRAALTELDLSPVAGALRPLLPELADSLPPLPEPLADPLAERHRVFRGLVDVVAALGPVLLVVEDLHWADGQTVEFLGHLAADPPPGLTLVVTYRDEDVPARYRAFADAAPPAVARAHVDLQPLSAGETRAMAARILDFDGLSDEFVGYLWERTSGLPLAVEELLALMQERGTLVRHGSAWVRRALDELDVPRRIRDAVLERVGRMSGAARAVVEAAAVLQEPQPLEVLVATAGGSEGDVLDGLDEAVSAGILADDDARPGFRHVLAAQAVYEATPASRRRLLHARAGAVLQDLEPRPLGQVAFHLRHAGAAQAWVQAAERAADKAVELHHDSQACRLLEDVLRHAPLDAQDRGRLAVKLARAATESLDAGHDVAQLLADVLDAGVPAGVRGELRFLVGTHLEQRGGDPVARRQMYAQAVEELEDRPDLRAWAMIALGIPTVRDVPVAELRDWLHRSMQIVPTLADPDFRVFLRGKAAMVLAPMGDPAWAPLVRRIVEETAGEPATRRAVKACESVAIEACYAGHHETAASLVRGALDGAARCGSRKLELRVRRAAAVLDYCTGSWDGLADRVQELVDELAEHPHLRASLDAVAGCLALARGDLDDARRRLEEVTAPVDDAGIYVLLPVPAAALVRLHTARDATDEAVRLGTAVLEGAEAHGLPAPALRVVPPLVEALVRSGREDEAEAVVSRVAAAVRDLDAPLAAPALRHAEGHVAAASHDWAAAAGHLVAAAEHYAAAGCRYEAAQAAESAAACLERAGEHAEAQARLRSALAAYAELGAAWDEARAARTARRVGVPVPGRHRGGRRGYGDDLSPREREVAALVAEGRTNEEIARELYLSAKTVEKHVSAAKRKLGAGSRAGLARQLFDADLRPAGQVPPHAGDVLPR